MLKKILSVAGITLLSRVTGFARDILLAAALGAGALADALVVAMKLPNQFRAIFAEGAFSAAYVPIYARLRQTDGEGIAQRFANQIFSLLAGSQLVLLLLALGGMPLIVALLAPGFVGDGARFDLAVALSRITFPYLLMVTLVTQLTGSLNAADRFVAGAFAPVLLNLSMIAALLLATLFPTAAHAAAWGVALAGVLELALLAVAAHRADVLPGLERPKATQEFRAFWKAFLPGVIGSSATQIAMLADLILSTLVAQGGPAAMYYADRLYQLPIGVIAIAAGTVLLPEMSRLFGAGESDRAHRAQSRALAFALVLSAPAFAAFLVIPQEIISGMFQRGAFTASDAALAAQILAAYGVGLPAVVMIRSAVASFHARSDTLTPMLVAFAALAVNVLAKILLSRFIGLPGLALATAIGAWINVALLVFLALRSQRMNLGESFFAAAALASVAAAIMGWAMLALRAIAQARLEALTWFRHEMTLAFLGGAGLLVYAAIVLVGARLVGLQLRRM
jgi:putative peptidoglycan lipid II flippase